MFQELNILKKVLPALHISEDVLLGPGDDCAAVRAGGAVWLLAADQVAGDVHFYRDATPPEKAGAKILKRNLSDIAAMGGVPRFALLTVAAGRDRTDEWVTRFILGCEEASERFGVVLAGGDLAALPPGCATEVASLAIIGEAPDGKFIRRDTARAGDVICVTGELGGSLASEHHLNFIPRLGEGAWLRRFGTTAMLDLSDGIGLDAGRLAAASDLTAELDVERLPRRKGATAKQALGEGEDYELCFTVQEGRLEMLLRDWPAEFAPLTPVGRMLPREAEQKVKLLHAGALTPEDAKGYEHGKN